MNKMILEDRYTTHQKITLVLYFGAPLILTIITGLTRNLNYLGNLILVGLTIIYFFLIVLAFLKRGFIKINKNLYRGSFFSGKLILKSRINICNTPKVAVLKFTKSQKYAWFSIAKPNMATKFNSFEINILNDRHTKRNPILILKNKNNIERSINFLTTNFDLEKVTYSPNFRKKTTKRRR